MIAYCAVRPSEVAAIDHTSPIMVCEDLEALLDWCDLWHRAYIVRLSRGQYSPHYVPDTRNRVIVGVEVLAVTGPATDAPDGALEAVTVRIATRSVYRVPGGRVNLADLPEGYSVVDKATFVKHAQTGELSVPGLTRVSGPEGITQGGWFTDSDGQRFYVKTPSNPASAWNELCAARLYELADVPVPDTRVVAGALVSREVDGAVSNKVLGAAECAKARSQRRSWFAVDAWLADWDAPKNWLVVGGKSAMRVDFAGAMGFRSRGAPKPFGVQVAEMASMRNVDTSPKGVEVFAPATTSELLAGIELLRQVDPDGIRRVVAECHGTDEVADTLIARRLKVLDRADYSDHYDGPVLYRMEKVSDLEKYRGSGVILGVCGKPGTPEGARSCNEVPGVMCKCGLRAVEDPRVLFDYWDLVRQGIDLSLADRIKNGMRSNGQDTLGDMYVDRDRVMVQVVPVGRHIRATGINPEPLGTWQCQGLRLVSREVVVPEGRSVSLPDGFIAVPEPVSSS